MPQTWSAQFVCPSSGFQWKSLYWASVVRTWHWTAHIHFFLYYYIKIAAWNGWANFGRSINPNLIQFFFFHPIGYLKINKNLFEPVSSDLIPVDPTWSLLIQLYPIWFNLIWTWTNLNQFDPTWSDFVWLFWFDMIWSDFNQTVQAN